MYLLILTASNCKSTDYNQYKVKGQRELKNTAQILIMKDVAK